MEKRSVVATKSEDADEPDMVSFENLARDVLKSMAEGEDKALSENDLPWAHHSQPVSDVVMEEQPIQDQNEEMKETSSAIFSEFTIDSNFLKLSDCNKLGEERELLTSSFAAFSVNCYEQE